MNYFLNVSTYQNAQNQYHQNSNCNQKVVFTQYYQGVQSQENTFGKMKTVRKVRQDTFCLIFLPLLLKIHFLRGKWAFSCVFLPSFLTCFFFSSFSHTTYQVPFYLYQIKPVPELYKVPKYVHDCRFFIIKSVALCPIK